MDVFAANLPTILCVVAGMALVVLEVFLPGFGLPGISGSVLLLAAIVMVMFHYGALAAVGLLIIIIAVVAIAISISLKSAARGNLAKSSFILNETESSDAGYDSSQDMEVFMGRDGVTQTPLRPVGIAEFDGVRLNVVTEGEFLLKDVRVTVVQIEGSRIVVRKA